MGMTVRVAELWLFAALAPTLVSLQRQCFTIAAFPMCESVSSAQVIAQSLMAQICIDVWRSCIAGHMPNML